MKKGTLKEEAKHNKPDKHADRLRQHVNPKPKTALLLKEIKGQQRRTVRRVTGRSASEPGNSQNT